MMSGELVRKFRIVPCFFIPSGKWAGQMIVREIRKWRYLTASGDYNLSEEVFYGKVCDGIGSGDYQFPLYSV